MNSAQQNTKTETDVWGTERDRTGTGGDTLLEIGKEGTFARLALLRSSSSSECIDDKRRTDDRQLGLYVEFVCVYFGFE